jgi:cystathionine beta-lyase
VRGDPAGLEDLRQRTSAKWRAYPSEVIPAWIAEMDMDLAPAIAEALHAAVSRSDTGYRWPGDLPEALAEFAAARWDWVLNPALVTVIPDVVTGICEMLAVLTNRGESVVITPPVYQPFFSSVLRLERVLAEVPMIEDADGSSRLDLDGLQRAFARPEVTAFVLCNPHNPTGTVPTRAELARIDELAAMHGVAVISDEIHAPLSYPGVEFVPYLSVTGPDAVAVSLVSASKAWNLAGLKCAQVVVGSESMAQLIAERMPIEVTYGTGHLGVLASIAAYRESVGWLDAVVEQLAERALLVGSLMAEYLPAVRYRLPAASYLAWLDCRPLGLAEDPAEVFLARGGVALSAGPGFGTQGVGFARLNFATSTEVLRVIVERMASCTPQQGSRPADLFI